MRFIREILFLLLATFPLAAQVAQLSDNASDNLNPKLIKDRNGRLFCFWRSNKDTTSSVFRIFYRRYENGNWSPPTVVKGSSNIVWFNYDVDLDTSGGMWLARFLDTTVTIFKMGPDDMFTPRLAFVDRYIPLHPYKAVTLAAVDSNQIWIDYSQELFYYGARWLYWFDGTNFTRRYVLPGMLSDYRTIPLTSLKTSQGKVHFLRSGMEDPHGHLPSPYVELLSTALQDSLLRTSSSSYAEPGTAGSAQDSLLYFFSWTQYKSNIVPTMEVINANSKAKIFKVVSLDFFPSAASKEGPFLAISWIKNNEIYLKGVLGTNLLLTGLFTFNEALNDAGRSNVSLLVDSYPNVWLAWQASFNDRQQIFIAQTEIPTTIDTSLVVSVGNHENRTIWSVEKFLLEQNFPNPFNPATTIQYSIPNDGIVTLTIYDLLGRPLLKPVDRFHTRGTYFIRVDASSLSSGIYIYRLSIGGQSISKTFIVLK